ncbi:MAG: formylglycine-generating enzyme family protein [Cyanobacteria bacterium J06555_13]
MALTLRRVPATARYYIEPLEGLGEAIPLQMLLIPEGTFLMGSPEGELERQEREGPQHDVSVPPFFMSRYPVTQAQWRAVVALPQAKRELKPDPSNFKGDNRPVEQVSWYDAVEFCDRLQQHTGRPYRLPSEAEWEYACRARTLAPFHFGKTLTTEVANYPGNYTYADGPEGEYREETTPVDAFDIANPFGLCDMHGNVLEWCADHYGSYEQTPTDGSAFVTEDDEAHRILRGGSWFDDPRNCRSAYRDDVTPSNAFNFIGFRVSCSAPRT